MIKMASRHEGLHTPFVPPSHLLAKVAVSESDNGEMASKLLLGQRYNNELIL